MEGTFLTVPQALLVAFCGLLIVFIMLAALSGIMYLLSKALNAAPKQEAAPTPAPAAPTAPAAPAKIPAARLRSQSEQAQPGVYSGTLASSPLFGSHPTKFRLVTKNRDNRETTVAYVYGNSGQLTSFLGETLTISGAIYWFRDTELPTVFAQDILRGKSGSAAAR